MQLTKEDFFEEQKYLNKCVKEIDIQIKELQESLKVREITATENKKYIWENKHDMDNVEIATNLMASASEFYNLEKKINYFKKLLRVKVNPYFGRIKFIEENKLKHDIYIGITHLAKDNKNMIYDWRAPISSMFYDCEVGSAYYKAPQGIIKGELTRKRQYKIHGNKIINIFDNSVNVTDDFLQEVLTHSSTDKMKNIVNTIQKEQNEVIRDIMSKNLIVQGIAGSGKTSVALHRIAFLLYKIENLTANNILIFSPNNIFSEYISNVLPELGESNAKETTFSDLALGYITKYKAVESYTAFIERYYTNKNRDTNLTTFKMSDKMISVIDKYSLYLLMKASFTIDIEFHEQKYNKNILNDLFQNRYSKMTLFERIELMAEHICNIQNKSYGKYGRTLQNQLWNSLNINKDIKELFKGLFESKFFTTDFGRELSEEEIKNIINAKELLYEDSLILIYLQGLLQTFPYNSNIKQIIIDEAQDYSKLQYIILKKIFPRASYTILGDINQNINPYYEYKSLYDLKEVLGETKYTELNKTYRSSPEIIEYSNNILDLKHAVSIRRSNNYDVINIKEDNIYEQLKNDIIEGKKHHSKIAIITKTVEEAEDLYNKLTKDFEDLNYLNEHSKEFNHKLVIIPSYLAKGLEFDYVIAYTNKYNKYTLKEKRLYYVVTTRAQHQLKIYNQ